MTFIKDLTIPSPLLADDELILAETTGSALRSGQDRQWCDKWRVFLKVVKLAPCVGPGEGVSCTVPDVSLPVQQQFTCPGLSLTASLNLDVIAQDIN